ncbi:MAG: DUF192 domain-containing protein [Paracoccaceae bacterium]
MGSRIAARPLILVALAVAWATGAAASCREDVVELRGDWGEARFEVEIADTAPARAQGLMFRESMAREAGMLFVYPRPQRVSFWMKNTRIPLDMIFVDETGTVRRVHVNAIPGDLTPIPGGDGIRAVLEINGGLSETMGISAGTQLRHPAFDAGLAAWPCP